MIRPAMIAITTIIARPSAQDCVVEMASRKPPTPQAQEDRAAQQQAAAALGQEQLANAQARKEASVAAGRAAEERLAPAVTAGPATLEQVTATGASSTGEVHHAPTLTKEQWRVVFEGNNLTRGYIIGSNGPMPAERAIFQWKPEVSPPPPPPGPVAWERKGRWRGKDRAGRKRKVTGR